MGPTLKNLKSLLRLPTGCGEQTMTNLAPDVFVYKYLNTTGQLTPDVAEMALQYMQLGINTRTYIPFFLIVEGCFE